MYSRENPILALTYPHTLPNPGAALTLAHNSLSALTPGRLPGSPQYVYHQIQKFTYKDVEGHEAPLYLKPNQVAGIVVARTTESSKNYGLSTR